MKWTAISGSWRKMNKELESDVSEAVKEVMSRGDGIVSGGALNVDYIALDEALKLNPTADRIKIFIPATLKIFSGHYRKRAKEGVITEEQAEKLIAQLNKLKQTNPLALVDWIIDKVFWPYYSFLWETKDIKFRFLQIKGLLKYGENKTILN